MLVAASWAVPVAEIPRACVGPGGDGPSTCIYRSMVPSSGVVVECRNDQDCRVGPYYGAPESATWIAPPPGAAALPKPEVLWRTGLLAELRFGCGGSCAYSYFFDARRHRLSPPRGNVLGLDPRRLLVASDEDRVIVVRQLYSGREVFRLTRPWAPAPTLAEVVPALRFDPDGRLTFTWLRGPGRTPVTERVTVPSMPR